jgi:hypothetical protein
MDERCSRYHGVAEDRMGSTMHELGPKAEYGRVHGKDIPVLDDSIGPILYRGCLLGILLAGDLNPDLNFR